LRGQYLALEATITIALSVVIAIGVTTSFVSLRDSIKQSVTEAEADIIQAELRSGVNRVKPAESGAVTFDIPQTLGGSEYTASMSQKFFVVSTDTESYRYETGQLGRYELSGSAPGGSVTVTKSDSEMRLRPGR
jgi:hypothetical protein